MFITNVKISNTHSVRLCLKWNLPVFSRKDKISHESLHMIFWVLLWTLWRVQSLAAFYLTLKLKLGMGWSFASFKIRTVLILNPGEDVDFILSLKNLRHSFQFSIWDLFCFSMRESSWKSMYMSFVLTRNYSCNYTEN